MIEGKIDFLDNRFTPAALPEVYAPRRKLLSLIHTAAAGRFVYIEAPAGSGKTVSARLWLDASGRKSAWSGLDEYDNAPVVFYKQLAAAILSLQPDNEAMRTLYASPHFSTSPVEHTIGMIAEIRPTDTLCAIVLDDAHLVTNGEIIKSLPAVLKRLPGTFVTLILSRNPMPDSFRRLIAEDCLITFEQLKFLPDEINLYFQSLGRFLSPEQTQFAYAATGGLAIGVNAAAMSEQKELGKGANVFAQYFEDNIWNTWDERTQDFCLKTSILDEFTPDFAMRLTGYGDAQKIMERLSRSNSFLSRLHEDVYRFHHLFQDFLRDKARRLGVNVSALYKKAAEYYKENGDYSMALRFWLDSGDYKGADAFLLLFMFHNQRGNIVEYVDFLRMYFIRDFPEKAFKDFPALHVCCAWYYYMTSQYKEFEYHADEGYKYIVKIARCDPKFVEFAMLMYSVDHRSRMLEKLKRFGVFAKLVTRFTNEGIIRNIASSTHNLPYMHKSSFDYCDAHADPKCMELVSNSFFSHLCGNQSEIMLRLSQAGFFYEQNNLEHALAETDWLLDTLTEQNSIELRVSARLLHHTILLQMGLSDEAGAVLNDFSKFIYESAPFFLTNLEAYKTKFTLLNCDKNAARTWLDNYYVIDAEYIELYLVFQHFTTVRAHIVLGDYEKARKLTLLMRDFGLNLVRVCDYGEASVLLAVLEWVIGKRKEAVEILESALERLQAYGLMRIVIDEGASVLPILKRIARITGTKEYRGKLKHEFVSACMLGAYAYAKRYKGITAGFIKQQKPIKLSKQQKLVITLLSKGYTNAMITRETGLKITTIRTHTTLAYDKLGVNNAMDAVLKARELGLI